MNKKSVVRVYKNFWREIFNFSGTEDRFEFWVPFFINALFNLVITFLVTFITGKTISETNNVFIFIPLFFFLILFEVAELSAMIRRLRDSGRKWYFLLVQFIPLIGELYLFILLGKPTHRN
ncbi:hypothetical protein FFRU_080700 [Fructobacillus fructosus]|uniref:DUF805 domain-containing protein n=1 Tax=Fructobacillus fructosus TaxID=1631 RepID=UPI00021954FA|nr:DUF805 domain-containing protein [Fructobacillus fructosus]GAP01529.1 hypothetical protein FFRU_080700 [Fructobacillus fructosus]